MDKDEYEKRISQLGRNILFTNCYELSAKEIIKTYKGKNGVEEDFKTLKDDHSISTDSMFCWTDPKIMVHLFCCVMALMLIRLLQRELALLKIPMSPAQFINLLKKIKESHMIYPGSLKSERILSECNKKTTSTFKGTRIEKVSINDELELHFL